MSRRPRTSLPPCYFHVINRSAGRAPLFRRRRDYQAFLDVLATGLQKHPVRLVSYCVLSNHWHLVVGPVDPRRLSGLMQWVTTTHAVRFRRHGQTVGEGPVYQGRFKSVPVESSDELVQVCRYVERNALEAGLVERAQDWPWCSLSARLRADDRLPLADAPFLVSDAWIDHVNGSHTLAESLRRPGPRGATTVENRYDPLDDRADDPGVGGQQGKRRIGGRRRDDQHESDAHVEGAKRLPLLKPARMTQPLEHRRRRPASAVK